MDRNMDIYALDRDESSNVKPVSFLLLLLGQLASYATTILSQLVARYLDSLSETK